MSAWRSHRPLRPAAVGCGCLAPAPTRRRLLPAALGRRRLLLPSAARCCCCYLCAATAAILCPVHHEVEVAAHHALRAGRYALLQSGRQRVLQERALGARVGRARGRVHAREGKLLAAPGELQREEAALHPLGPATLPALPLALHNHLPALQQRPPDEDGDPPLASLPAAPVGYVFTHPLCLCSQVQHLLGLCL